jgi:hypothetical protein
MPLDFIARDNPNRPANPRRGNRVGIVSDKDLQWREAFRLKKTTLHPLSRPALHILTEAARLSAVFC